MNNAMINLEEEFAAWEARSDTNEQTCKLIRGLIVALREARAEVRRSG